jgi:hypothetical protein
MMNGTRTHSPTPRGRHPAEPVPPVDLMELAVLLKTYWSGVEIP